jgi:thioredoxin-related protein
MIKVCGKILCKLEGPECPFCNTMITKSMTNDVQKSQEFQNAINQKLKLLQLDSSEQHKIIHGNFFYNNARYCF